MRRKSLFSAVFWLLLIAGPVMAETAILPCVSGQELSAAVAEVQGAGFAVSVNSEFSDTVASGAVIRELPLCGGPVDTSNTVSLVQSLGSIEAAGKSVWGTAFQAILTSFALGIFAGLLIKLTNRS